MTDLYTAGADSTVHSLTWALAYLLHNQHVLHQLQAHIDDVIGPGRRPTLQDKANLAFVEATLLEVQRMGDVVPFGVSHATTVDVEFRGYHIPKGTMVMANQHCVHRDERHFPCPFSFDPTRFLDENGRVKKVEQLLPFGTGRFVCINL